VSWFYCICHSFIVFYILCCINTLLLRTVRAVYIIVIYKKKKNLKSISDLFNNIFGELYGENAIGLHLMLYDQEPGVNDVLFTQ
jgi:hypothetical protein